MELSGSTALITGAAHRVGKGIALDLAKKGTNILVHYGRSEDKAKQTVEEIRDLGVEAEQFSVDLRDIEAITSFMEQINNSYNYQLLVNSAASFVKQSLTTSSLEDWQLSLNINTRAPFFLTKLATPVLSQQSDSLIVNISDLSGVYPWQSFATHGISKAGLIHLTKIAARELAPSIRVNAILPGPILPPPDMSTEDPVWQEMIGNVPLQRSGSPRNIGQTVIYFATNEYVTGAVLHVDGGEGLVGPKNH